MGEKALNIAGMIVIVAAITAVVTHKESANVIKSMGTAFSGSINSALGKG